MSSRILSALTKQFEKHRIIFWYDNNQELQDAFDSLVLDGVEKVKILNNELGLKHRILREQPTQKFLLYKADRQPADLDNWLLDVQLAHGEFRTDQTALWLADLELGIDFVETIQEHADFFGATKRKDALKKLIKSDDTQNILRMKMIAVCAGSDVRFDAILEHLLQELANGKDEKIKLIQRCGLDKPLWEKMNREFGYASNSPTIRDFVMELFKSCFAMATNGAVKLNNDALVFLKRWKDSRQFEGSFGILSAECAESLSMEKILGSTDFRELIEVDYFRMIDQKIIVDLVHQVSNRLVSAGEIALWVRQRRQGHWYSEFEDPYRAIEAAAEFIRVLDDVSFNMSTLADGIQQYSKHWFKLDQLYRKFISHYRNAGQASLLGELNDQIENLYTNNFLTKLNNRWQVLVDDAHVWDAAPIPLQRNFFNTYVRPFLEKDKKVYVIISDAFRYEIGEELLSMIRHEDRFEASIEPVMSMLPSYTQLGMAALLPNKELKLTGDVNATTEVDGINSKGTPNRQKILDIGVSKKATAIRADDLIKMNQDESRAVLRENDVVYIYHNLIDITGKLATEERVFSAVDETLEILMRLIKKLASANASNMIITSDHGFIYQYRPITESDYLSTNVDGDEILYRDRRFVLGRGLKESAGFKSFASPALGLVGDIDIQIPKSINRLRLQGAASRFVHGGATLQEVVIPVIRINKKRQSDLSIVDVEIIRGTSSIISSGQLAVVLYQGQAVTEKLQARHLTVGIYTQSGELISNSQDYNFDLTSESPRDRELHVSFILTRKADAANGQEVVLRLDEKVAGTNHIKEYKSLRYTVRRSFTSDFDF